MFNRISLKEFYSIQNIFLIKLLVKLGQVNIDEYAKFIRETYRSQRALCLINYRFGNVLAFKYVAVHYTPNCTAKMKTKRKKL